MQRFINSSAVVLTALSLIAGCGGRQEAISLHDDGNTPTSSPDQPTPAQTVPTATAHIDSVLMKAAFTCTGCQADDQTDSTEPSKTQLAAQVQTAILSGFDKLINSLGSDLKTKPDKVSIELNDTHSGLTVNPNVYVWVNGDLLTSETTYWSVQRALAIAVEAWAFTRMAGVNYLEIIQPLAEAASITSLSGAKATCQYFSGVSTGPNLLVKSLCDSGAFTAERLWSLTKEMGSRTAASGSELTRDDYLSLWMEKFGQAGVKAVQDAGLIDD